MDDIEIINLFFNRDEKAINELKKNYETYLRKVSMNILGDESDAEECLNDSYLSVWNSIPPAKPEHLLNYVSKIVKNKAINKLKHNKRVIRGGGLERITFDELENCISNGSLDDNLVNNAQLRDCINDFLRSLNKDARVIFIRRYWYLDSISEIATRLACSEGKIKMSISRTKKALQKHLRRNGYEY